ncbi:YkvI family membrane protein [Kordiimonas aquimaris]|uniref:YkvI family membrane protein n=1 Tax=Kordiimonas aquimaris TaxID=707591 RepID=UPI0021D33242|nr:hypothetical protein [Kordiimonas aquimaris]
MAFFRLYILPGFILQSVVIGGGYATGRELIEFFFSKGPLGGILGLIVSGIVFGVVAAAGFEFARTTKTYDYRQFCRALLGRGWVIFEIAFVCLLLLILSVIGSASGEITEKAFGLPPIIGTIILMSIIGVLTFTGSSVIKRVLAGWSFLLYGVYSLLFILAFATFGPEIQHTFTSTHVGDGWITSGILYSGYNLAILPAILFAVTHHKTRKQTVCAGLMAGLITILPAILFYTAMMAQYPSIGDQPVPATYLMAAMQKPWLELVFQIVVFGTFIETGAALLHAVNERLDSNLKEQGRTLQRAARPLIAIAFLCFAIFAAANFGIIELIGQGYGFLTLIFIAVLIIPLLTKGLWIIGKRGQQ